MKLEYGMKFQNKDYFRGEKDGIMKTFEEYLIEQIGLNFLQCYEKRVKNQLIKEFFQEWCYDYCPSMTEIMDTIEIMEKENIYI